MDKFQDATNLVSRGKQDGHGIQHSTQKAHSHKAADSTRKQTQNLVKAMEMASKPYFWIVCDDDDFDWEDE